MSRRRSPFVDMHTTDGRLISVRRDKPPVRAVPHRRKPIVTVTFEDGLEVQVAGDWFELRLEFELDDLIDLAERAVDKVKDLFDGPDEERDPTPVPLPPRRSVPVPGLVVSDISDADPDTDEGAPVPG